MNHSRIYSHMVGARCSFLAKLAGMRSLVWIDEFHFQIIYWRERHNCRHIFTYSKRAAVSECPSTTTRIIAPPPAVTICFSLARAFVSRIPPPKKKKKVQKGNCFSTRTVNLSSAIERYTYTHTSRIHNTFHTKHEIPSPYTITIPAYKLLSISDNRGPKHKRSG